MTGLSSLPFLLMLVGAAANPPADVVPGSQLVMEGDLLCPSEEAIRQALAPMRPPSEWPADLVVIRSNLQRLSIDLGRASVKQRELVMEPDCQARASATALVIATWMDDLPAEVTGAPVLEPLDDKAEIPPRGPAHNEIGAGLSASAGGGLQPGGYLEFVRLRPESDWGWLASLALVAPREVSLDGGNSRWMRTSAALGAQARTVFQKLLFAADFGLAAAYTAAWGSGYASDKTDASYTWGPFADLRAGIPWGRFRLWIEARANWWVRPETMQIDAKTSAGSARHDLPAWDAQGALGASYVLP
jgi:hypothetical protein